MSWQNLFVESGILFPPKTRVIIYLQNNINKEGFILTTIKNAAFFAHASYATTQKVFEELIDERSMLKIRNRLYAPLFRITNKSRGDIDQIILQNQINENVARLKIGDEIYLCPKEVGNYLRKQKVNQPKRQN